MTGRQLLTHTLGILSILVAGFVWGTYLVVIHPAGTTILFALKLIAVAAGGLIPGLAGLISSRHCGRFPWLPLIGFLGNLAWVCIAGIGAIAIIGIGKSH